MGTPQHVQNVYTLTPMQKGMLFHALLDSESVAYVEQFFFNIVGSFDPAIFEESINELILRHDILRTIFNTDIPEQPLQVVLKHRPIKLHYVSILDLNESDQQVYIDKLKQEDRESGFDLHQGPLMRVSLVQTIDNAYTILWTFHHILMDGWSIPLLTQEVFRIYQCKYEGIPLSLPEVPAYEQYIEWLEEEDKEEAAEFWEAYLQGYDQHVQLPQKRRQAEGYQLDSVVLELTEVQTTQLHQLAKTYNVTLNTLLQTAWGILLHKYNASNDAIFGSVVSGRPGFIRGIEAMIGLFINTIPVRIHCSAESSFIDCVQDIQEQALDAADYHYYPLFEIQARTRLNRDLINHIMVFENAPLGQKLQSFNDESPLPFHIDNVELTQQTNYDLNVIIIPGDRVHISFDFNAFVYDRETIELVSKRFNSILEQVMYEPDIRVQDIGMVTDEEKQQILEVFNHTEVAYKADSTIHTLFEEQVLKTPDHTAVVFQDKTLTYRALNNKADQLAGLLRRKGVGPNQIVGIMTYHSIEMIIGIMGILKAGGAYVPIDPAYPEDRIQYILEDSGASLLLTQRQLLDKVNNEIEQIDLENAAIYEFVAGGDSGHSEVKAGPRDLAYVIYTSGTTGKPKGVMIEHHALINLCMWHQRAFKVTEADHATKLAGFGFDASVWEVFPYLTAGASLHILEESLDVFWLNQYFEQHDITISFLPTPLCEKFMELENHSLRILLTGGDRLKVYRDRSYKLINNYGPTESTVVATSIQISSEQQSYPIGKPIDNYKIYIVDGQNQLQPAGIPGELCIAGAGLARGYVNLPELTAEKFADNPFVPGQRIYRTGDLARWLPDGSIEFLGRMDHQVKIRGYRIELGEIESQLVHYEPVKSAVVIVNEDPSGDKALYAYFTANKDVAIDEIKRYLLKELPHYMVPAYVMQMEELPLTPNGKVDREALSKLGIQTRSLREYAAPQNETEETLTAIWQEVLGLSAEIGIHDHFFELGGHSLKATTLAAKMHQAFDVHIPLKDIFAYPTIHGLAQRIVNAEMNAYSSIPVAEPKAYYALSSAQRRMYVLSQLAENNISYNMPSALSIKGHFDIDALEDVFQALIRRHEVLRTSFELVNGEPVQIIHPEDASFEIDYVDLTSQPEQGAELIQSIQSFVRPFDLSKPPLFRIKWIQIDVEEAILLFDMHHIISDAQTMDVLAQEITLLLNGSDLPELKIQYKDYSEWQNEMLRSEEMNRQKTYWLNRFAGELPVLELPADYARPSIQSFEGDRLTAMIDSELKEKLLHIAVETGSTLYMVLLSAYTLLLSKYTGQDDIVVGTPISGRQHGDLEHVLGMFVNTLAMRNFPEATKSFKQFLNEVKQNALDAYEHQDYPFEDLVEQLNVKRDMSRNPLFDTMFSLQNAAHADPMVDAGDLKMAPYQFEESATSKFDLTLDAIDSDNGIAISLEFSTKLFKKERMEQLIKHFVHILSEIAAHPEKVLNDIQMLSEQEKEQILVEFNPKISSAQYDQVFHGWFEKQAEQTPDHIAVVYQQHALTYKELNQRANQLARALRHQGVGPNTVVAMMVDRSVEMIVGVMGILKAGGAYLPIDPAYPQERIQYMLEDSQTSLLLTQERHLDRVSFTGTIVNLESEELYQGNADNLDVINTASDLAYVIYTSGTTGKPKGVMIEHRSYISIASAWKAEYNLDEQVRLLQMASFSFDVFAGDLSRTLLHGGCLVLCPEDTRLDMAALSRLLIEQQISIVEFTPAIAIPLLSYLREHQLQVPHLRILLFGGEGVPAEEFNKIAQQLGDNTRVLNTYGVTEAAIDSSFY